MLWLRLFVLALLALEWWDEPLHGHSLTSEPLSSQPALLSAARPRAGGDSLQSSVLPQPADCLTAHGLVPPVGASALLYYGASAALPRTHSLYLFMALRR